MCFFSLVRDGQITGIFTDLFEAAELSREGDEILWSEEWPLKEEAIPEKEKTPPQRVYCRPKARPELLKLNHHWN